MKRKEESKPAKDKICKLRIPHKCCSPKSLICEHQRKYNDDNDNIVEIYPIPISVICTHLKKKQSIR